MSDTTETLVSVIIPAYNCEAYIEETLKSVFAQSYQNFEVIVVNDGSIDGTVERLAGYHDRIVLLHQRNQGPGAARNLGIKNSKGGLIAFLDADDLWPVDRLSNMVALMVNHPEADIVRGQIHRLGGYSPREAAVGAENLGPFSPVNALFRASLFVRCGVFDPSPALRFAEDLDWYLRCCERGITTIPYQGASVLYRRTNGMSANFESVNVGILSAIRRKLERERAAQSTNQDLRGPEAVKVRADSVEDAARPSSELQGETGNPLDELS